MGAVTWAFEFENQPYFEGFRSLATNGVDKPVLNAFRMFGLLGNERLAVDSSGGLPSNEIVKTGVRGQPDVNAIAARKDHEVEILVWNYHDDDVPGSPAPLELSVGGLPSKSGRCLIEHYRVDANHSNAFTAWKEMGSPQAPSSEQQAQLEAAGQLQLFNSPKWSTIDQGSVHLEFSLPRQGLSLVRISW
jgi:xylan 1,4-beta-xylosidase